MMRRLIIGCLFIPKIHSFIQSECVFLQHTASDASNARIASVLAEKKPVFLKKDVEKHYHPIFGSRFEEQDDIFKYVRRTV